MSRAILVLGTDDLVARVDVSRGCDIIDLIHAPTGTSLLLSSPWRAHAEAIRDGRASPTAFGSMNGWLEQYTGGWQTLCPNAGAPRAINGADAGYHGEASATAWDVESSSPTRVLLSTEMYSIPLRIDRELRLESARITIHDTVRNLSDNEVEFDYAQHPAFGGDLLDGPCLLETGARTFVNDSEAGLPIAAPDSRHPWPLVLGDGGQVDLSIIPSAPARGAFGWLTDFDSPWARITNPRRGMSVRLDWDGEAMPHAWFWQELSSSPAWPWFGRARTAAIEPSSCATSGPDRTFGLRLGGGGSREITTSLSVDLAKENDHG